jgi:peptidoglycan/xylan/chitin deacetylase (PgdA/CDA1 family)
VESAGDRVNALALMYHDVTEPGREDASGFRGGEAARYKLAPGLFRRHLRAIRERVDAAPITTDGLRSARSDRRLPLLLTFDDGGASGAAIADELEAFGWRGHLFVTAGYIDRPGFLTSAAIRDLTRRGHIVGSHSWSHPLRMAHCSRPRLAEEWRRSVKQLSEIIGAPVRTASVPGGDYSIAVGEQAAAAGIEVLFTSRATTRVSRIDSLHVLGRYPINRRTTPERAAAVAAGAWAPRMRQLAWWDLKTLAKSAGGSGYLRVREALLGRSPDVTWGDEVASLSEDPS